MNEDQWYALRATHMILLSSISWVKTPHQEEQIANVILCLEKAFPELK